MASAVTAPRKPGFFRTLWRVARQIFHETTGAVFFLLALTWASAALRYWRQHAPNWEWKIGLGMAVVMVFFGAVSFRAARRVR